MPLPWSCLHILPSEVRLRHSHRSLRDWISGMRLGTDFDCFHHRTRNRRLGRSRNDVWRYGPHDQRPAPRETTCLDGRSWCDDGHRECCRTVAWRCFDDACELEMVFLQ